MTLEADKGMIMKKYLLIALSFLLIISLLYVIFGGGQKPVRKETAAIPNTGSTQSVMTTTAAPASAEIAIQGFAFDRASVTVKVGAAITWTNQDSADHTITSDKGDWDSGKIAQGGKYSHTFDQVGTFTYHCSVHPAMKGTVVVIP
jgi:plastocyanin